MGKIRVLRPISSSTNLDESDAITSLDVIESDLTWVLLFNELSRTYLSFL